MTTGDRLKRLRESHKYTQLEIANELDVSISLVQKWERGEREVQQDELVKLSKMYGVSVDYLFGLEHQEIDFAFYNKLGELTEEQKKEIIKFAHFIRSK